MKTPTLAEKLGISAPVSPVLQKAGRLGLGAAEALEALAVARGCWHYRSPDLGLLPSVEETEFSNEELAIALLSPALPYSPHTIRVGAAMLGAPGNNIETVVSLAAANQAVACVGYVASAATGFEPDNPFWRTLLTKLPDSPAVPEGVMPHPTRFVSMTGFTRQGKGRVTVWIRPRPDLALVHG